MGWVIMTPCHPMGNVPVVRWETFRPTREEAISVFIEGTSLSWRQWKKQFGFVLVRASADIRISTDIANLKRMGTDEAN